VLRLIIRGIMSRKLRTILTSLAIILGVAMVAGTSILTGQINSAFDDIFETGNAKIDAVVERQTEFDSFEDALPPMPESIVETVRQTDGVARADGQIEASGQLVVDGETVESQGGAPAIVISTVDPALNPSSPVEGRLPDGPGEVAIIKDVADREDLTVGQTGVELATNVGTVPVEIVGIFRFGDVDSIGGATVVLTTFDDAQRWFDREGQTSRVVAAAEEGVSPQQLKRNLIVALPGTVKVETGEENAQAQSDEISDEIGSFLTPVLSAFYYISLFVGAFIIFNTFWITVAQRVREFGMLRALGASRGQIMRNVIGEAFVMGLLASIVGVAAGFGIAAGILALFDSLGFGLPATDPSIDAGTVITCLILGTAITVIAAIVPAVRATAVPPIAAAQEGATLPPSRFAKAVPYLTALFAIGGILLIVSGLNSDGAVGPRLAAVGFGAVIALIGIAMASRYVIRPFARFVGAPIEATAGTTGRIARHNATRNPGRTALTAAVLMIGVTVISFVAIFSSALKDSFTGAIDRTIQADVILQTDQFTTFPASIEPVVRGVEGVEVAEFLRFPEIRTEPGGTQFLNTIDPDTAPDVFDFDWQDGSDALFAQLGTDGALIEQNLAKDTGLGVGDSFTVRTNRGNTARFEVLGTYRDPVLFTGIAVTNEAADLLDVPPDPSVGVVKFAEGADPAAVQEALAAAVEPEFPTVNVDSQTEFKENFESQIDQILVIFYALGVVILIICLFGIVNVLALSVVERTREIGMLRAIGTTRPQMRAIVRYESIITSVMGGILGIVFGALLAWLIVEALSDFGFEFSLPIVSLIVILVVAIIVGVLAALVPARRAARLNPLDALHQE
jgi:putative ABC transport system permease protein